MAGKIDFQVSANPEKAVADLAKIINKQDQMIDKLRASNREAQKTKGSVADMGSPMKDIVADVGKMAAGWLTAQGIIQGVRSAVALLKGEYDDIIRKMESARGAQIGFGRAAIEAIRMKEGVGPEIEFQVERLRRTRRFLPNVPLSEIPELYSKFAGAYPTATFEQSMAAVEMAGGPVSKEGRLQQINLAGQIQRLMPELSTDDAFDLAAQFLRDAGEYAPRLTDAMQGIEKMVAVGADPEGLLARLTTAVQRKQKPRLFSTMGSMIAQVRARGVVPRTPGKPLSEADELQNRIAAMSTDEILAWADTATESELVSVFGSTWASVAPAFGAGVGARGLESMRAAMTGDVYRRESEQIRRGRTGKAVVATDVAAAIAEDVRHIDERYAATGGIRKAVTDVLTDLPGLGKTERFFTRAGFEARGLLSGDYEAAAFATIRNLEERFGPTRQVYTGEAGLMRMPNVDYSPEILQAIRELRDVIRDLADRQNQPVTVNVGAGMD